MAELLRGTRWAVLRESIIVFDYINSNEKCEDIKTSIGKVLCGLEAFAAIFKNSKLHDWLLTYAKIFTALDALVTVSCGPGYKPLEYSDIVIKDEHNQPRNFGLLPN